MVGIAVSWATGITTGVVFDSPPFSVEIMIWFLIVVMIACSCIMSSRSWVNTTRTVILAGTFLTGRYHAHNSCHTMTEEQMDVASFIDSGMVYVKGRVSKEPTVSSDTHELIGTNPMQGVMNTIPLECVTLTHPATEEEIDCSRIDLKVSTLEGDPLGLVVGDTCHARARVLPSRRNTNPGCEDGFRNQPILVAEHPSLLHVERSNVGVRRNVVSELCDAWRNVVSESLMSSTIGFTDPDERNLIKAIVLGDRNGDFMALSQPYKRTGTAHYLAVSGFAIGVFSSLPAMLMRGRSRFLKGITTLAFLSLGLLAIDLRSPAIRSGAVIVMATFGFTVGREWSRMGLLSLTSIIMLAVNPEDVLNPGFQLTFLVVSSLMVLTPRMLSFIPRTEGGGGMKKMINSSFMRKSFSCGVIAWLTSTPLIIHHFGIVCPIGILASIFLMPFMSIMITASVVAIVTHLITPSISFIPGFISGWSMKVIENMVHFFDSIPGSFYLVPEWSFLMTMTIELLIWRLFLHKNMIERLLIIILFTTAFVFHFFQADSRVQLDGGVRIVTMDVGNGTCHLIMTGESNFLFDGGSLERRSCGRKIILPVLDHYGIEEIDGVFISHANIDHFSGLPEVMERVPIGTFFIGESFINRSTCHPRGPSGIMMKMIEEWRIPWKVVHKGMRFTYGRTIFEIHNPIPGDINQKENDNSLVVSLKRINGDKIEHYSLFTGDIEDHSMRSIMDDLELIGNPILLEAPHHGSVRGYSPEFIDKIHPSIVIQSTGAMRMRRDGLSKIIRRHPDMKIYSTASHGAIQIDFHDSGQVEVKTQSSDRL
ncbi:MAG: hypothetical protein CMJ33_10545 [Phycisphaerae bacterium]|nr:hypothetical protein [Phycisphaerae bacterium]